MEFPGEFHLIATFSIFKVIYNVAYVFLIWGWEGVIEYSFTTLAPAILISIPIAIVLTIFVEKEDL